MFDKLTQLKQLRDLQKNLQQEKVEIEQNGIKVVINGKMEIEQIQLNSAGEQREQERILLSCLNEAIKKIQLKIAQKMSQMDNLNL